MLIWTLEIAVLSLVLIFLVHYLFNFFKSTLTIPKVKDLVNSPNQKYENMYNIISKKNNDIVDFNDLLPKNDTEDMKNELKNFLKQQMTPESDPSFSSTSLSSLPFQ
jgi:hypothetical protein